MRRVVVTGMGAVTPIGIGVEAFWENVKEPDYGDVSEKLDFKLHPLLHTTYYRKQLRIQILKNVYS